METIESFLTQENLQSVGSIVAQPNNPGGGAGGGGNNNNPVDLNMSNGLPVFFPVRYPSSKPDQWGTTYGGVTLQ